MDRLSNELLKPMVFPAFPRLDEINDFFKGLSVGILKNGTYLPCQIIGAITKNSDICDFPKTLEATDVNNECIYRAGILTADVASMISGVIMTVLGISSIIGGSVTSVGGIAATGTGVGALVGIPTIVVSSGVVVSGVVQSVTGVSLVYSSVKSFSGDLDDFNRAKEKKKTVLPGTNTETGISANKKYTGGRTEQELRALAEDPAHSGSKRPIDIEKGQHEARIGLELEERGLLKNIKRDATGKAEFIDELGQAWDVKSFNSRYKPNKGGFRLDKAMNIVKKSLSENENVIIDTSNLSTEHIAELTSEVTKQGLQGKVLFWP